MVNIGMRIFQWKSVHRMVFIMNAVHAANLLISTMYMGHGNFVHDSIATRGTTCNYLISIITRCVPLDGYVT